jgi:integrase
MSGSGQTGAGLQPGRFLVKFSDGAGDVIRTEDTMAQEFGKCSLNYLDRKRISPGSACVYARHQVRASASLGRLRADRITRHDVERTLAEAAADGLAPATVKGLLSFTRAVLRDVGSSAADGISVRVPDAKVRAMSEAEATAFRAALPATTYGAALLVLLRTGLRESELLNMEPDSWARASREAHVLKSKSGRRRVVDVPNDAAEAMSTVVGGERLCTRQLRRVMATTCQAAGVTHFRVHDLRHTRATHQLLAGIPVLYVSAQLGHSNPGYTLTVYGHLMVASRAQRNEWSNA